MGVRVEGASSGRTGGNLDATEDVEGIQRFGPVILDKSGIRVIRVALGFQGLVMPPTEPGTTTSRRRVP